MRQLRPLILALGVVALSISGPALAQEDESAVEVEALTVQDVLQLAGAGVGDEVIIAKIHASGQVFQLSVDEIVRLKRAGVSDEVLAEMVRTGVREHQLEAVEVAREVEASRPRVYVTGSAGYGYGYPFSWWYPRYRYRSHWSTWPYYWGGGYYGGYHGGHHGNHHGGYSGPSGGSPRPKQQGAVGGRGGRQ